jgi:small subunit ribosomal protein S23
LTGQDELEEDRIFERIFLQLTAACRSALQALPIASRQFSHYLELAEEGRTHQTLRNLWIKLVHRSRICLERSEALHVRLSNMKVKEPGGGMRNQREFWLLSKAFISSFVDVITDMQELKHFRPLPSEIPMTLLPVQKATREASRLLDASPWSYMLQLTGSPSSTMTTPTSAFPNGSSPQNVQIPVTPLGAALGHAAQATFPSTPASASSERFFAGDIFQRADSLLATSHAAPIFARR